MNIREILNTNFPAEQPEVSNEGLVSSLRDFFKRKKKDPSAEAPDISREDVVAWVQDNLYRKTPGEFGVVKNDVTLAARYAPLFQRQGRSVSNIAAEFRKDLVQYRQLFQRYKGPLKTFSEFLKKVDQEATHWLKRYPGVEHPDEFTKLLNDIKKRVPKSTLAGFTEPSYSFLGWSKTKFTDSDGWFRYQVAPEKSAAITLAAPSKEQVEATVELVMELEKFVQELADFEGDSTMGLDVSDPPFRGYSDEVNEAWDDKLEAIFHPLADDQNSALSSQLVDRAGWLLESLCAYLKAVVVLNVAD